MMHEDSSNHILIEKNNKGALHWLERWHNVDPIVEQPALNRLLTQARAVWQCSDAIAMRESGRVTVYRLI